MNKYAKHMNKYAFTNKNLDYAKSIIKTHILSTINHQTTRRSPLDTLTTQYFAHTAIKLIHTTNPQPT